MESYGGDTFEFGLLDPTNWQNFDLRLPEITKLLMQAQEAFRIQADLGLIDPSERFDTWRRDQVMSAVGRPGSGEIWPSSDSVM